MSVKVPDEILRPLLQLHDDKLRAELRTLDRQIRVAQRMLLEGNRELRRRRRARRGVQPGPAAGCSCC